MLLFFHCQLNTFHSVAYHVLYIIILCCESFYYYVRIYNAIYSMVLFLVKALLTAAHKQLALFNEAVQA